ncbi:hypothetical protein CASFOL_042625 [Castilleja foliolosa]|uniref:J domain-containing protein n=1 Tax=Castilleja foliolosa TaxID=1961234 RepID=A0ABD3B854_9LAMI
MEEKSFSQFAIYARRNNWQLMVLCPKYSYVSWFCFMQNKPTKKITTKIETYAVFMDSNTCKDHYKVLEVDYDATDDKIRCNYRKLALKWHPDKHKGDTAKFQEINEAYTVLIDPNKRLDYDLNGNYEIDKYTLREYLSRFKGMILTCNGLGISHTSICVAVIDGAYCHSTPML